MLSDDICCIELLQAPDCYHARHASRHRLVQGCLLKLSRNDLHQTICGVNYSQHVYYIAQAFGRTSQVILMVMVVLYRIATCCEDFFWPHKRDMLFFCRFVGWAFGKTETGDRRRCSDKNKQL